MNEQAKHLQEEADIGSGEKTPGQHETEKEIKRIPKHGTDNQDDGLNDARAQQQMIESNADTSDEFRRIEQKRSGEKEHPAGRPHETDPAKDN